MSGVIYLEKCCMTCIPEKLKYNGVSFGPEMTYEELLAACKDYILNKFDDYPETIDRWRTVTYWCSGTLLDVTIPERDLHPLFRKTSEELIDYLGNLQERGLL